MALLTPRNPELSSILLEVVLGHFFLIFTEDSVTTEDGWDYKKVNAVLLSRFRTSAKNYRLSRMLWTSKWKERIWSHLFIWLPKHTGQQAVWKNKNCTFSRGYLRRRKSDKCCNIKFIKRLYRDKETFSGVGRFTKSLWESQCKSQSIRSTAATLLSFAQSEVAPAQSHDSKIDDLTGQFSKLSLLIKRKGTDKNSSGFGTASKPSTHTILRFLSNCGYCGNPGNDEESCSAKQRDDRSPGTCSFCEKRGHYITSCWTLQPIIETRKILPAAASLQ